MMISQDLFDETLLESQELFEYDNNELAVEETVKELQSQDPNSRLDHLSLTHPYSAEGKRDRDNQQNFVQALESQDLSLAMAIVINANASASTNGNGNKSATIMFASLVLQHGFLQVRSKLMKRFDEPETSSDPTNDDFELEADELIQFLIAMLMDGNNNNSTTSASTSQQQHPLIRELKLQLGQTFLQEHWFPLFDRHPLLRLALLSLAKACCNGCEANKKILVHAGIRFQPSNVNGTATSEEAVQRSTVPRTGIELWVACLPKDLNSNSNELMTKELCQLLAVLGKFQASAEPPPTSADQGPVVSSAHSNVKEFYKCGAVPKLHQLAVLCLETHPTMTERKRKEREGLLCQVLSALRVMAIDNDIVQNMVAVGILDTLNTSDTGTETNGADSDRTLLVHQPMTAAATLGLLRNLCANDEIKSTLCRQSLASILQAMDLHATNSVVQEHGCGILAAMSLRNPHNASTICHATNGAESIVKSMKAFPNKVPLQRQACLALRNIASRASPEDKQKMLDAGTEFVLREIAGRHQESIDEAYAALRDLGCAAVKYTLDETGKAQGTQLFGTVQSNFRPVYD